MQEHTDLPICIDSSIVEALEAGLDAYEGKALVNSVTGEDDRIELILPLVKKYGAAVIVLANDETGIPETVEQRLEITRKIVSVAGDYGIPLEDIVIDPLAMPIGADPSVVRPRSQRSRDPRRVRLQHVPRRVEHQLRAAEPPHAERGVPADGQLGRPDERDHERALARVRAPRHASDLLMGNDPWGANWIAQFRRRPPAAATA